MHSLSVSVCPCLSVILCARTFCMWLHWFGMLSCPDLRLKTASSLSWGGSPMGFFNSKYVLV